MIKDCKSQSQSVIICLFYFCVLQKPHIYKSYKYSDFVVSLNFWNNDGWTYLPIWFNLGSFVTTKQRPAEPLAYIHSKPVNYTNNGGGRDTYISDSAGGLKSIY